MVIRDLDVLVSVVPPVGFSLNVVREAARYTLGGVCARTLTC